jgi:hypothetical protein
LTGRQDLKGYNLPSGRKLTGLDLGRSIVGVRDPQTQQVKHSKIKYTTAGSWVMTLAASPNGTIVGNSGPHTFIFEPKSETWTLRPSLRQWNTIAHTGDLLLVGAYTGGYLIEWNPFIDWTGAGFEGHKGDNPRFLVRSASVIDRPHKVLAIGGGKTFVMSGAPGYGRTGGGMLFYNSETEEQELLNHMALSPNRTVMSIVELDDGKLLCGTSTRPGSGGRRTEDEAELFIMDPVTKQIEWRSTLLPGAHEYTELVVAPDGKVFGLACFTPWDPSVLKYDRIFFVFDPVEHRLLHKRDTVSTFGQQPYQQGPRNFVKTDKGEIYVLFINNIVKVNPKNYELKRVANTPLPIVTGGDYLDGRIFFSDGSRLISYVLPD